MDDHHETDELTLLEAARPDPAPTAATVDAHRAALATAMRQVRTPTRWGRVAAAAAVVPLVAAAAVLATRAPDGSTDGPELQLASSHAFYGAPRCGEDPPPDFTIPNGFSGPIESPSPDAETPAQPDQLVRHWTKGSINIEVRWYADADAVPAPVEPWDSVTTLPGQPLGDYTSMTGGEGELPSGRHYWSYVTGTRPLGSPATPCTWTQLMVYADDFETANETMYAVTGTCSTPLPDPLSGPSVTCEELFDS